MTDLVTTILQARTSSSRLPGKVLKDLLGAPMLARQIERIRRSRAGATIVVATSENAEDDAIAHLCEPISVPCYRGPLDDVLARFYGAACQWPAPHIVRLTGDCPLADPELIDRIVDFHIAHGYDYTSNTLDRFWPKGLDVEVTRFETLKFAAENARSAFDKEHVMPFLWSQPDRFKLGRFIQDTNLSDRRWTVDYPEDFELVQHIYNSLYPDNPEFTTSDILAFLARNPDIERLNAHYET